MNKIWKLFENNSAWTCLTFANNEKNNYLLLLLPVFSFLFFFSFFFGVQGQLGSRCEVNSGHATNRIEVNQHTHTHTHWHTQLLKVKGERRGQTRSPLPLHSHPSHPSPHPPHSSSSSKVTHQRSREVTKKNNFQKKKYFKKMFKINFKKN